MHDLIEQIEDARLRERLRQEWEASVREKKFGLVFEPHLPELLPLPKVKPRRGDLVCMRDGSLKDLWRVRRVANGVAFCVKPGAKGQGGPVEPVQFSLDELLVVRQFGEPIFPALIPVDQVQNGEAGAPWHTLIEADNFHALQLLDYLYAGQVDCIYIDPPYNTGARDWKYNNDYVDGNDGWRHSKWLAFMEKRLKLAKRLLKPDTGVLIVTIDEHEVHHLGMLLEREFPEAHQQLVTIVINQKGVAQGRLSRAEEYALFCFNPAVTLAAHHDDLLSPDRGESKRFQTPRWEWLLRGGTNSRREDRYGLFFPITVDPALRKIVAIGDPLPPDQSPDLSNLANRRTAWPLRTDDTLGNWRVSPPTLRLLLAKGYVRLGGFDEARGTWTVLYLGQKAQKQIEAGVIEVVRKDEVTGEVEVRYTEAQQRSIKTVWHRATHDAGNYGSSLLRGILGEGGKFSFPKSIYATRDAVAAVVRDRPYALILDFFAGSGTTLNAVNLLNATDGGQRRCILVTNNEVSAEDAAILGERGLQQGDAEWEAQGICRAVTWPRSKFTILGHRDDGSALAGDYLTGKAVDRERARNFTQIGFVDPASLDTLAKKKQVVALIDGLPQTLVKEPGTFVVSDDHKASVLFDPSAADDWLEALDGQDHITDFYIVTPTKRVFDSLKARVVELLGTLFVAEEEKRPIGAGFASNLAYFKLDFLDKDRVALKQAFREVLPMLWLKAGAVGPRPELPRGAAEPPFFDPSGANFAVLLDEGVFRKFVKTIGKRTDLSVVYIVTDADEAFKDMADEVRHALRLSSPSAEVVQLYKDYLANFLINTRLDLDLNGQGGQA
jgi:adenine-specific DNA-methyltransferase